MNVEHVRGFNYQPSYAWTGADIWRRFDAAAFDRELGWGKKHFPKMNAVRLWLAWEVFAAGSPGQREQFLANVEAAFGLAAKFGLAVMPVLFNRWHAGSPEWGGVFLDNFLPGRSWANHYFDRQWREYIGAMMARFGDDPRVIGWDLCNEPFSYFTKRPWAEYADVAPHEQRWLEEVYAAGKAGGARAPLSVGFWAGIKFLEPLQHISDVLNFHRYWMGDPATKDEFRRELDALVALRERTGKPLLSSEACWGSLDNAKRAEIIEFHLGELNRRKIGWFIYALQHSHVADLHWPEYGLVTEPGTLHCIEPDGSLRPGHGIINRHIEET
jgi:hypothetical protein